MSKLSVKERIKNFSDKKEGDPGFGAALALVVIALFTLVGCVIWLIVLFANHAPTWLQNTILIALVISGLTTLAYYGSQPNEKKR